MVTEIPITTDKDVEIFKKSIDENAKDTPHLSIDPETHKTAVVGDPNEIEPTIKPYTLRFSYQKSQIKPEDLGKYTLDKETGYYYIDITYDNVRIKPLYRTKVALRITQILTAIGVVFKDGYSTDTVDSQTLKVFTEKIDEIAEIIKIVLGVPEDQLGYLDPKCLMHFWVTLLENEPNILKEGTNFLF